MRVEPQALTARLQEKYGPAIEVLPDPTVTTILVPPERLPAIAAELAESFNLLLDLTAVDWPEYFEVVYFLWSVPEAEELRLKVRLPKDRPEVSSVSACWPAALCLEREAYDLLGIVFRGHPDLRRILCPDDFVG
ncbi:MAG: NADH-quinone oxidoreductase subunit C, partial [Clostridia bacterium]|nr:NADH-quinone oxidoreductase subunit C [Clostridia bacterium]